MLRKLRTFERHIDQFNKEAKEAHQPTIEVGELDKEDLDKVPSMDDLEVCGPLHFFLTVIGEV